MSLLSRLTTGTALALIAGVAQAQVTADDVWANVQAQYRAMGAQVTGTLARDGNVVTVSGIEGKFDLPMGVGQLTVQTSAMILTENGDGTVAPAFAPDWTLSARLTVTDEPTANVGFDLALQPVGYVSTASGTPDAITFDTSYDRMDVSLVGLATEGIDDIGAFDMDFFVSIEGSVTRTVVTTTADLVTLVSAGTFARVITDYSFVIDGEMTSQNVSVTEDGAVNSTLAMPAAGIDILNLAAALRAGLAVDLTATAGQVQSQAVTRMGDEVFSDQSQTVAGSAQSIVINQRGIDVTAALNDLDTTFSMTGFMPMVIDIGLDAANMRFAMPLLTATEPAPAGFEFSLAGLTGGDELWGLLGTDTSDLRLPIDMTMNLNTMITPRMDLVDVVPLVEALDSGVVVAEVNEVVLDTFHVRYGATELSGSGRAVLDWVGITYYEDLREPVGEATFVLRGAYALLDNLIAKGVLPQAEAMAARAGLAGFGRATGDDELTSTITISPEGGLVVNGQRMD